MRHFIAAAIAVTVGSAALVPAVAQADTAANYNLFVLNNMTVNGSDEQGRVAVGGNASLTSHSVGALANPNDVNLVVGGNLTATSGSTVGKTIVGGTASYTNWSTAGLQPHGTPSPINFATEAVRLDQLTDYLDTFAANGAINYQNFGGSHGYQTALVGTNSSLNVFDLDGLKASETNTFTINIKPGSIALINVSGVNDVLSNAGITIIGGDASDVLWNFYDATSLSFQSIGILGSALAPDANYAGTGVIDGQLIVNSFSNYYPWQATQVNDVMFSGDLLGLTPPVPEPAVWTMMIAGFGLAGGALRRRRSGVSSLAKLA
jgi:choice-of-anchor A domain-containing protein